MGNPLGLYTQHTPLPSYLRHAMPNMRLFLCLLLWLPTAATPCTNGTICQLHIALGCNSSQLRVSWVSVVAHQHPVVQFGLSPTSMPFTANASAQTYTLSDMCSPVDIVLPTRGWESPGTIYHATIDTSSLGPNVFYRVGDAFSSEWSQRAGPVRVGLHRDGGRASFAAFGDMGTYAYAPHDGELGAVDDVVNRALLNASSTLDAVFHVGDIAYANDGPQSRNFPNNNSSILPYDFLV